MRVRVLVVGILAGLALAGCRDIGTASSGDSSAAPDTSSPSPAAAVLVMPDVTGQRWSDVRHKLLDLGFDDLNLHDGTGRDRPVIVAKNWVVRSQVPAPGTRGTAKTRITLTVTKPTDRAGSTHTVAGVVP
ncbi:MAG TPA: PASTA domain-containing protein, partial [Mycobacteriales bacterium]|nr:PASTA domain-containing protein [Mycobacteriales bacterium]